MLKDLFNDKIRAGLARIEMHELEELDNQSEDAELCMNDSVEFYRNPEFLRIECTRKVYFDPECIFEISATYFVEHFLTDKSSLDSISDEEMEKEIFGDLEYYSQQKQGFMSRISLLIAQVTSTFGGVPAVFPPFLQIKKENESS